jgi:gliding motility-associated-like protein
MATTPLTSPYYTSDFSEIFVRAAHPNGCFDVSNFFLAPNCENPPPTEFDYSIPTYFSPNGDTHNPFWNLQEISAGFPEQTQIQIFDRYGKLLYRFNPSESPGWDGTYQGKPMPASDYWFSLLIPGTEKTTGHFSLIR